MRRALGWMAVALLSTAIAALLATHLRPSGADVQQLLTSVASLRPEAKMETTLPAGSVDPNRATAEELEALSGVGQALAQRIVEEREQNGPFHYPEDLLSVSGIGEKTLQKLRDQLCMEE